MNFKIKFFLLFITLVSLFCVIIFSISDANDLVYHYTVKSISIVENWKKIDLTGKLLPISEQQQLEISHPPFSYYFLYTFNKFLPLRSAIIVVNILLTFISTFSIYLLISLFEKNSPSKKVSKFGIVGAIIYITSVPVMKYQISNFHPDIFVQPLVTFLIYVVLKSSIRHKFHKVKYLIWYALFLFLSLYSSWVAYLFCFIFIVYAIFQMKRSYKLAPFIAISIFLSVGTAFLIFSQYSLFLGYYKVSSHYFHSLINEIFGFEDFFKTTVLIFKNLMKDLGNLLLCLVFLILFVLYSKQKKIAFSSSGYKFVVFAIIPVLIYNFVLYNYFQNSYHSLYYVPFLSIALTIWIEKINKNLTSIQFIANIIFIIVLSNLITYFIAI